MFEVYVDAQEYSSTIGTLGHWLQELFIHLEAVQQDRWGVEEWLDIVF